MNKMIQPSFLVFVDPFAAYAPEGNPPDAASMLVQRLVEAGYNPYVDARGQPIIRFINEHTGFVVVDDGRMIECGSYTAGHVRCLQAYAGANLDSGEIQYLMHKSARLYNLDPALIVYDTATCYDYLEACLSPVPENKLVEHSDFLGNTIRIYDDQAFVIDPVPATNELKREAVAVE